MEHLKLLFYLLILISVYNLAYIIIKIECIDYYSTITSLLSYIVSMFFIYLALKNRVTKKLKMSLLIYYTLQIILTIATLIYLQTRDECCATRKLEIILYFCMLYINLTLYGFLLYLVSKTQINTFQPILNEEVAV